MTDHGFRRFFVVVLLLVLSTPAFAALDGQEKNPHPLAAHRSSLVAGPAVVFADSWGVGHFLSGGGRARVVQITVVAMSIALFIMMRKLNG